MFSWPLRGDDDDKDRVPTNGLIYITAAIRRISIARNDKLKSTSRNYNKHTTAFHADDMSLVPSQYRLSPIYFPLVIFLNLCGILATWRFYLEMRSEDSVIAFHEIPPFTLLYR